MKIRTIAENVVIFMAIFFLPVIAAYALFAFIGIFTTANFDLINPFQWDPDARTILAILACFWWMIVGTAAVTA